MKLLAATILISLSAFSSEREMDKDSNVQVVAVSHSTTEWCTCNVTVEEAIFLQQYDFQ